jgi:hypothetical protein
MKKPNRKPNRCKTNRSRCIVEKLLNKVHQLRKKTNGKSLGSIGPCTFVDAKTFFREGPRSVMKDKKKHKKSWNYRIPVYLENANIDAVIPVGDIHGDLASFLSVLHLVKVIDNDGNLRHNKVTKKTAIIFCGDLVDRGGRGTSNSVHASHRDELDILQLFTAYQEDSKYMINAILGNHELGRVFGHYGRFVGKQYIGYGCSSVDELHAMSRPGSNVSEFFRHRFPALMICNNVVCIHGGVRLNYIEDIIRMRKHIYGDVHDVPQLCADIIFHAMGRSHMHFQHMMPLPEVRNEYYTRQRELFENDGFFTEERFGTNNISESLKKKIREEICDSKNFHNGQSIQMLKRVFMPMHSPLPFNRTIEKNVIECNNEVQKIMKKFNITPKEQGFLVLGHTVQPDGVPVHYCGQQLFRIDTALSLAAFGKSKWNHHGREMFLLGFRKKNDASSTFDEIIEIKTTTNGEVTVKRHKKKKKAN